MDFVWPMKSLDRARSKSQRPVATIWSWSDRRAPAIPCWPSACLLYWPIR